MNVGKHLKERLNAITYSAGVLLEYEGNTRQHLQ
jgi:hypothetical protein